MTRLAGAIYDRADAEDGQNLSGLVERLGPVCVDRFEQPLGIRDDLVEVYNLSRLQWH